MSVIELAFESELSASPEEVWAWITSIRGIRLEMAPLLRMTTPRGVRSLEDLLENPALRLGERLFRSRLLLFGVLPIDYSDLTLIELRPGAGFIEESPMGSMRRWRHERTIVRSERGVYLRDRLVFEPRLPARLAEPVVRQLFTHRHRMLKRYLFAADG